MDHFYIKTNCTRKKGKRNSGNMTKELKVCDQHCNSSEHEEESTLRSSILRRIEHSSTVRTWGNIRKKGLNNEMSSSSGSVGAWIASPSFPYQQGCGTVEAAYGARIWQACDFPGRSLGEKNAC